MEIFILYTFVSSIIYITIAAPVNSSEPNIFLKSIEEKCPQLTGDNTFTNPQQLQKCKDWNRIESTKVLNETTEQDVLCLLYHDSLISFCNELKKQSSATKTISEIDMTSFKAYTIEMICDNGLDLADRIHEHNLHNMIISKEICYKLCGNYEGIPVYECAMAHYFATFDFEEPKPDHQNSEKNVNEVVSGNPPELSNAQISSIEHTTQNNSKVTSLSPQVITSTSSGLVPQKNDNEIKHIDNLSGHTVTLGRKQEETATQDTSKDEKQELQLHHENVEIQGQSPDIQDDKQAQAHPDSQANQIHQKVEIQEQHIDQGNKVHANVEIIHPQTNQNQEQIQKKDSEKKENTVVKTEGDDIKIDDAEEGNQVEEDAEESMDAGMDGEPVLPSEDEKSQQQEFDSRPVINSDNVEEIDGDSYFFSYFMVICVLFILGYVGYHNRLKVMALVLEGKRNKRQYRGRRPNSANYHKLDSNLEEAISSNVTKNSSNVIY